MEPRRYLRCLGQPALLAPNGEPIRFRTKKHLALLVYLAVEQGRPHRRERLAELLWPRARTPEARHSLATALSILRPRLGAQVLRATRDHVSLEGGGLALDLDRLLARDILGDESGGPLDVAAFLDGFDIPDASEFALWKDRQQARLLPAIKDALVVLIDRCRRTADTRQIEQLADRMLALDELSEEAIRAKMEARAFAGDRLTGLKIFEEWKEKLAEELGAVPTALVEGMAVRLRRRGWERTTLTEIPTVPTDQWRGRAFIGRGSEYRVLYEAWEGMRKGVSTHPLVLGDSGIGKTTLVERLTTAAGLEGAAVSRVQCYELEREIPYAAIGGLVHGLLDRPGASATPPEALAELSRTMPEVRRRFPSIPAASDSQGETARLRLTEAFHDLLQAIAEEHPVILVVDDLHLADDASLAVLHLVMRRAKGQRIMVIMIARPGELTASAQARRVRESGKALNLRELHLGAMTDTESRSLLSSLISSGDVAPQGTLRRSLLRAAAGYPMVLELLVRDWQESGSKSLALALEGMTVDFGSSGPPPAIYTEVLDRLVSTLDPGTLSVLNLAAILGRRLNDIELYGLVDLNIGQTAAGMSELVRRRVLRDGGLGLEFVNELVRTAAYLGVPSPLRRVIHSNVADRFLERSGTFELGFGLEVAWHCIRAGRLEEAIPQLLRGAQESIRVGAADSAERALSSALPHLSGLARARAQLLLVEVLQEQGLWLESRDVLDDFAREFGTAGSPELPIFSALAKIRSGFSTENFGPTLEELLGIVESCTIPATRARAARAAAYVAARCGDEGVADRLLSDLRTLSGLELDAETHGQLALAQGLLLFRERQMDEALRLVGESVRVMRGCGVANLLMAQSLGGLGTILASIGRYSEAAYNHEEARKIACRLGNDRLAIGTAGNLVLCYLRLGRYEDVLEVAAEAAELLSVELEGFTEIQLAFGVAFSHAIKGRSARALEAIAAFERRPIDALPPWMRQAWLLWKADTLYLVGQRGDALGTARQALAMGQEHPLSSSFIGPYCRWYVQVALPDVQVPRLQALKARWLESIQHYDAIDQVEVLAAITYIDRLIGECTEETAEALRARLLKLPEAVGLQLKGLGAI